MEIKIGNINQPFRSREGMTGREHKRTSGVKKGFSILTVCWSHSVLVTQCTVKRIYQNSSNCTLKISAF